MVRKIAREHRIDITQLEGTGISGRVTKRDIEAFIAADVEPLTWTALTALDPDTVADTTFRLRPGTSLLDTRWPLLELLSAKDKSDSEVSVRMDDCSRSVLVYRQGLQVRYRAVAAEDADFLELAGRGLRLEDLALSAASEAHTEALVARARASSRGSSAGATAVSPSPRVSKISDLAAAISSA